MVKPSERKDHHGSHYRIIFISYILRMECFYLCCWYRLDKAHPTHRWESIVSAQCIAPFASSYSVLTSFQLLPRLLPRLVRTPSVSVAFTMRSFSRLIRSGANIEVTTHSDDGEVSNVDEISAALHHGD